MCGTCGVRVHAKVGVVVVCARVCVRVRVWAHLLTPVKKPGRVRLGCQRVIALRSGASQRDGCGCVRFEGSRLLLLPPSRPRQTLARLSLLSMAAVGVREACQLTFRAPAARYNTLSGMFGM